MKSHRILIIVCLMLNTSTDTIGAIVTQPTSLSPGQPYRLAFVTSGKRDGLSANIEDYNSFVTDAANAVPELAALGANWKAIGSTPTVDARNNTDTVPSTIAGGSLGVPIFLLNDTKLADSNDDLWDGSISVVFNRTEANTQVTPNGTGFWAWTGSRADGTGVDVSNGGNAVGWQLGGSDSLHRSYRGYFDITFPEWIGNSEAFANIPAHFYAISSVIQVPEPCTLILGVLATAGLLMQRRDSQVSRSLSTHPNQC